MSIRILHVADAHLGARCAFLGDKTKIRAREQDFRDAFASAMDVAADPDRAVDIVAASGDLFDTPTPEPSVVEHVTARFRDLRARGIEVFVVPGTHDTFADLRSVYRRVDGTFGAHVLCDTKMDQPVTLERHGETVHVYGMAAQRGAGTRPLAEFHRTDASGYHIGLIHASIVDVRSHADSTTELVVSREEMTRSGLDYVALGHFHNFRRIECGRTVACYPGSTEGRKFGENGPRYVVLADLSPSGITLEQIQINRRTLNEIELEPSRVQISSTRQLLTWIETHVGSSDIVRLRLTGAADFPIDTDAVKAAVRDRFFHFELIDDSSIIGSERIKRLSAELTVRGLFVRKMAEKLARVRSPEERAVAERALRIGLVEMGACENDDVD